jgi:hypothetical protein
MSDLPSTSARALRVKSFQQIASVRYCSLFDLLPLCKNELVHHGTMRATIRAFTDFNIFIGVSKGLLPLASRVEITAVP